MGGAVKQRLGKLRPRASWQGPVGVGCVVAAVGVLASPAWALLAVGAFLLLAAASTGRR